MQQELASEHPELPIHLLAVNADGYESGLGDICAVGDLPVLQDTDSVDVWGRWDATWRDVIILDRDNLPVATYNLSTHSLADPDDYAELKALLVEVAQR